MTFKAFTILVISLSIALLITVGATFYYRGNAIDFKSQRDKASEALKQANATINDMQLRQRDVAAIDAKYTQELADAKATIDQLHDDVANGKRWLRINASCEKQSTTASSLDDATSARLTDSAQRDYFTLRDRIETANKQIAGLQEYIRKVCLVSQSP
ncbi:lysis protein [Pantoea stewartii]|uniref:lysis protein n=1 Tax=Pantoea stewartii TaxID=66269 RepID=UPI002DBBC963|nr:lysis protein [Pantoea stewartii]MEB6533265.1 lysis protein [Pantoea stewartii]